MSKQKIVKRMGDLLEGREFFIKDENGNVWEVYLVSDVDYVFNEIMKQ